MKEPIRFWLWAAGLGLLILGAFLLSLSAGLNIGGGVALAGLGLVLTGLGGWRPLAILLYHGLKEVADAADRDEAE